MNVTDVVNRVKRIFGDEGGVQITDLDLVRWINDAQVQIGIANEGLLETTATANIVQGQAEYDVPTDMSVLRSLAYKGFRIKYMSFAEFNEYIDGFDAAPGIGPYGPGIPEIFMVWNNKITVFPKPNESVTNGLKIYYVRQPTVVTSLGDNLTVPIQYHNAVVDYCLTQAYELDEDLQKASYNKGKFDETMMKLQDRNKWTSQEYYPRITTLPEDENYGNYGYWGGYF
jgi:hypothetical protein